MKMVLFMKKMLRFLVVFAMLFCQFYNVHALEVNVSNSIDLTRVLDDPDVSIEIYDDVDDYISAVENDVYINECEKEIMISEARAESKMRAYYYEYAKLRFDVSVTSTYHCYPYFYIKWKYSEDIDSPLAMVEVKNANIDRQYNNISKQFDGSLYYNLESDKKLYWDLNGDFYNNGTTSVSGGASIKVSEYLTLTFSVTGSSNHYKYIQYDKTYKF